MTACEPEVRPVLRQIELRFDPGPGPITLLVAVPRVALPAAVWGCLDPRWVFAADSGGIDAAESFDPGAAGCEWVAYQTSSHAARAVGAALLAAARAELAPGSDIDLLIVATCTPLAAADSKTVGSGCTASGCGDPPHCSGDRTASISGSRNEPPTIPWPPIARKAITSNA